MNWNIDLTRQAADWLENAPSREQKKVGAALDRIQEDPSQVSRHVRAAGPLEIIDGPVVMALLVDPAAGSITVLSLRVDDDPANLPRGSEAPGHRGAQPRIPRRQPPRALGRLVDLVGEIRIAARALRRRPAFTTIVLLTLALGLAATGAVFTVVDAVLLRPLPFVEGDRLVMVWESSPTRPIGTAAPANVLDWRELASGFEDIAAYNGWSASLTEGEGDAEEVPGAQVTYNMLDVLRIPVAHGRGFRVEDSVPGQGLVVLLGHEVWQRRFGGDPGIVGTTLSVDGVSREVVGILPPETRVPDDGWTEPRQVLVPYAWEEPDRGGRYLHPVGRLADGVTLASAQAEMDIIAGDLERAHPVDNRERGVRLMSLRDNLVGDARRGLLLLAGAVVLLLGIVVINIGNLVLARGDSQSYELALRAALGAGRGALLRLVAIEAMLLSVGGTLLGVLLLAPSIGTLRVLQARFFAATPTLQVDGRSIALAVVLAGVVGATIAFIGAARTLAHEHTASLLRSLGSGSRHSTSLRAGLVVAQVALSVVLLVGAGLLSTSFFRQTSVPIGFQPEGVVTFDVGAPRDRYPDPESVRTFHTRLFEEFRGVGNVLAVGLTADLPFTSSNMSGALLSDGLPTPEPGAAPRAEFRNVSPGYLDAAGVDLLRGRDLNDDDLADGPPVVLVNEAMAAQFWPGREALGSTFRFEGGDPDAPAYTVVGVVADELDDGYGAAPEPLFYVNARQSTWRGYSVLVRVDGTPEQSIPTLRAALARVDPLVPLANPTTMTEVVANTTARSRAGLGILALFTVGAVALATLGVYGILAHSVAQRSVEIGVRTALGASSPNITGMVMRDSARRIAIGLGIGVVLAALFARSLEPLLYETTPSEASIYVLAAIGVALVSLLVSLIPARRAANLDPITALRHG